LNEWKKTLKFAKKVYTNPFIFDTICNVTEERQTEAARLAEGSDAVIVIGSRSSSNTQKLYDICKALCRETYLIECASDLSEIKLPTGGSIAVTAGASTPLSVIQEVEQTMNEQITENFEEMLDASMKTLNPGDVVVGVITSISQNEIHLDLGAKTTGVIVHEKLTDDPSAKLDELFKVGDEIKAKVIKVSDIEGIAMLDKTRVDSDGNWNAIVEASEAGEILEGKIVDAVKGGVIATVKSVRIFIPASLTGLPRGSSDEELHALVGTTQKFKVIEVKEERKRALGSIRAVLREERRAKEEAFWAQVEVGQIYEGAVKSLTNYGAFVDLGGGVDGMVHMSELSWRRIRHPSEVVSVGDVIKVFVKGVDKEKKRISLGYKTEESDPWYIFTHKYAEGDVATVKIVSLMQFGAFAEVVPGADGLIHISQITDHKIASPAEVLHVGDEVQAKIVGIDNENRKISLSMRALIEPKEEEAAPAEEAQDAAPAVFSTDNPEAYADFGVEEAEKAAEAVEEATPAVEEKVEEAKEAVAEKAAEVKEAAAEKVEEAKEAVAEKASEIKEAVAEKVEEAKEAVAEKASEVKEAIADKIEEVKEKLGKDE
jgi:4-hydroxy-3-methylbut-2-enyl diphosphate reductase